MKALKSKLATELLADSNARVQLRRALTHPTGMTGKGAQLTMRDGKTITAKLVPKALTAA